MRKFSPSSAHIWAAETGCLGFTKIAAEVEKPREKSEAQLRGSACHSLVESWLGIGRHGERADVVGSQFNGVVVTADMYDWCMVYYSVARKLAAESVKSGVETRLVFSPIDPRCSGKVDFWSMSPRGVLTVVEFKTGARSVDPRGNLQLMMYAAHLLGGSAVEIERVELIVVQPSAYDGDGPVRVWSAEPETIRAEMDRITARAIAAKSDSVECTTGPHCARCDYRHVCPALEAAQGYTLAVVAQASPWAVTPGGLSAELRVLQEAAELLKARVTGLEAEATSRLKGGEYIPGYGLERSSGRVKWTVPDAQAIAIASMMGHDIAKPPAAITPKQAAAAGLNTEVIDGISERSEGSLKLVRDNLVAAKTIFGVK